MEITPEAKTQIEGFIEDFEVPYVRVGEIATGGG